MEEHEFLLTENNKHGVEELHDFRENEEESPDSRRTVQPFQAAERMLPPVSTQTELICRIKLEGRLIVRCQYCTQSAP